MIDIRKQTGTKTGLAIGKQRTYNEVVEYLDAHWATNANSKTLDRIKKLDAALGGLAQKVPAVLVAGTNGKSLTINFASKLFKEEGLKVGAFYSPHILTYNERLSITGETISNKIFAEIGNEVINASETENIEANSYELLTMMAISYFNQNKVDVALFEVNKDGEFNAANICDAKVVAITRATFEDIKTSPEELKATIKEMSGIIKKDSWLVSGDQNKEHLQMMQDLTVANGGNWAMPIRKLAALAYPFEQLHGRCAALAERIAQIFVEKFHNKNTVVVTDSLLSKPKGTRGRPSLEAKKQLELHPKRTAEQLWTETVSDLPGRFQVLDKEKPTILLDTANNVDALKNLLLGIRLMHYKRPLKGLTIIMSATKDSMHNEEFLKLIRYFFKKTSGQLLICPMEQALAGANEESSWDTEQVQNDLKAMKVKAKSCKNFEEAFDIAKKSVDEKYGLVVITGSVSIINKYWAQKGIKKF